MNKSDWNNLLVEGDTEKVLCPEVDGNVMAQINVGFVDGEFCGTLHFDCPICDDVHSVSLSMPDTGEEITPEVMYGASFTVMGMAYDIATRVIKEEHGRTVEVQIEYEDD